MIFPLSVRAKRRIYAVAIIVLVPFSAKAWLRFGPDLASRSWKPGADFFSYSEAPPALFSFHASLLLKADLGYPRKVESLLPAPDEGSKAATQLTFMGWWSKGWTAKALERGHVEGRALAVDMGELVLDGVEKPTPARDYNGPQMCQVDYWARWNAPDDAAELLRTAGLTGLRAPARVECAPKECMTLQATLVRDGWGWKLDDAEATRRNLPGHPKGRGWAWLGKLL